jgi:CBS domain-containing protein
MTTVRTLLEGKGSEVWTISPDDSVYRAVELMAEKNVGGLIVTDGDKPVGIITERDYARAVVLKGRSSASTPVRDIMTRDLICVSPDETVDSCMAVMTDSRVRHLPVLDDDRLIGIISIGDLVKSVIAEQQFKIEQLESYIQS